MPKNEIRAVYDDQTITVYQAYNHHIADIAIEHQTFTAPPFKTERMTWIKPSFLWMMYRSGWAQKKDQESILEIKILRSGFEWALQHSAVSHFRPGIDETEADWKEKLQRSPVRVQWDPDRDIFLQPKPSRAIQVGLSGEAVQRYISEWIVEISDITTFSKKVHSLAEAGNIREAISLLPAEQVYPYTQ